MSVFTLAAQANSIGPVAAYVTATGTYDDGSVYVFFDRAISSCNCEGRIDVDVTSPARDTVLAIAMAAFSSGKAVKVYPKSCNGNKSNFSGNKESYFYLTNENPG